MSKIAKELIWHSGVAFSLAILVLCTALLLYSGFNGLLHFPASTGSLTVVLLSSANNVTDFLAPRLRSFSITIEATFLVAIAAFIGLLEALSRHEGFEQLFRSGDPIRYADFVVSAMHSLATIGAWQQVLREPVFWQLSSAVFVYYTMRLWASRGAA